MCFPKRYAILLGGDFVLKKRQASRRRFPDPDDIVSLCEDIAGRPELQGFEALRKKARRFTSIAIATSELSP